MKNIWNDDTKKAVNNLGDMLINIAKWGLVALLSITLVSIFVLGEIIMKLLEVLF